ncbi:MAG: hypothetical protein IJX97_01080 [Clostridia bacterium]|nr:hypothetical protein [Clostridia bacterium]
MEEILENIITFLLALCESDFDDPLRKNKKIPNRILRIVLLILICLAIIAIIAAISVGVTLLID